MAIARTAKGIIRSVRAHYTKRRQYAELRECDPRMLRDIGLRWERGNLVAINPEREQATAPARPTPRNKAVEPAPSAVCPCCGARLA
ncbi:DUF1127 domain-containing protein [Halomonas heilongjiangensis]|uniref:YjiS-like domain-containing protein n=1 Tax=Halomonas heilongjiangensis TaxID=1387883 RepID=A0A2N7TMU4_9GAMM|nr:DUF1127 domain-containing protein [Halomonas heilongjiangensis]PMR69448.1 hypothetical protein C1H66_10665 [Halomonas heilongjiangensis]PXX89918.1 hypothetical protein CR158_10020 [Halomonas heilongjiangensis]